LCLFLHKKTGEYILRKILLATLTIISSTCSALASQPFDADCFPTNLTQKQFVDKATKATGKLKEKQRKTIVFIYNNQYLYYVKNIGHRDAASGNVITKESSRSCLFSLIDGYVATDDILGRQAYQIKKLFRK
jgi:hypothetical protein